MRPSRSPWLKLVTVLLRSEVLAWMFLMAEMMLAASRFSTEAIGIAEVIVSKVLTINVAQRIVVVVTVEDVDGSQRYVELLGRVRVEVLECTTSNTAGW